MMLPVLPEYYRKEDLQILCPQNLLHGVEIKQVKSFPAHLKSVEFLSFKGTDIPTEKGFEACRMCSLAFIKKKPKNRMYFSEYCNENVNLLCTWKLYPSETYNFQHP